jgi:Ca2+-binding EF-hand superfamily protein
LPKDDPDVESIKRLLVAADRNHDGVVTRGELIVELASIGEAERKLDEALPSLRPQP